MAQIQQSDVDELLRLGRNFYKGGSKSGNKLYADMSLDKYGQRMANATHAMLETEQAWNAYIAAHPEYAQRGAVSQSGYGAFLYNRGVTAGNCGEMAAVITHLGLTQSTMAQKATHHITAETRGAVGQPDHAFNIYFNIETHPNLRWPPPFKTINEIAAHDTEGMWAIDLWSKVACPLSMYVTEVQNKAATWQTQSKMVASVGQLMPAAAFFVSIGVQRLDYDITAKVPGGPTTWTYYRTPD